MIKSGRPAFHFSRVRCSSHAGYIRHALRGKLRLHRIPIPLTAHLDMPSIPHTLPHQRSRSKVFSTKKDKETSMASIKNSDYREAGMLVQQPIDEADDFPLVRTKESSAISAYAELAKARLSALVVTTTAAGFVAAGPLPLSTDMGTFASVLVGTALCSSSAAAWNQILEVSRDQKMKRTLQRPLVTGALTNQQAIAAATTWGIGGTALLWYGTDPVTTALGVTNIALYAGLYTAMKPVTTVNTWVGAVVGAIPPVMGYSAALCTMNGGVVAATTTASTSAAASTAASLLCDPIALSLAATLYLWQLPHFMALSYMYRADYTRGGFAMMPCHSITGAASADVAAEQTANVIVRYSWYLGAVPIVATAANVTSSMFALEGLVLNGYAIAVAHRFHRDRTNQNARAIFLTSLWYLPCTLMLFLLHSKSWDDDLNTAGAKSENALSHFISTQIHAIRERGRELCLHEQATVHHTKSQACPVVVGSEKGKETVDQAAKALSDVSVDQLGVAAKLHVSNSGDGSSSNNNNK